MQKKFEINRTKIKGGCQSGRKVLTHDSMSELPLDPYSNIEHQSVVYLLQKVQIGN